MSESTSEITRRCLVSGQVQGVWYRGTTRRRALELGLGGRATNLSDGRVEVVVSGSREAVDTLCGWLWQGPAGASVEDVRCEDAPLQRFSDFDTR